MEFVQILQDHFQRRRRVNSGYSLRAYARDLGMNPSTLSKVLKGERNLPFRILESVSVRLKLGAKDRQDFFSSVLNGRGFGGRTYVAWPTPTKKILKNDLHFQILSEWEYFAFLNLMKVKGFCSRPEWISHRLGISLAKATLITETLLASEMIRKTPTGDLERLYPKLETTDGTEALALRIAHQNELKLAITKLWNTRIPERDFFSMTLPTNPLKLQKAKLLTRQYFREMEALLEDGELTEVYQLAVQLFPLTKKAKKSVGGLK